MRAATTPANRGSKQVASFEEICLVMWKEARLVVGCRRSEDQGFVDELPKSVYIRSIKEVERVVAEAGIQTVSHYQESTLLAWTTAHKTPPP